MNQYDLLTQMSIYKQLKQTNADLPSTFVEYLSGLKPVGDDIVIPAITSGDQSYEEAIGDVEQRGRNADFVTNELGMGEHRVPGVGILGMNPTGAHKEAADHRERLDVRREIGYDK